MDMENGEGRMGVGVQGLGVCQCLNEVDRSWVVMSGFRVEVREISNPINFSTPQLLNYSTSQSLTKYHLAGDFANP